MQSNETLIKLLGEENEDLIDFEVSFRDIVVKQTESNFNRFINLDSVISFYNDTFIEEEELKVDLKYLTDNKINFKNNQILGNALIAQGIDVPKIGTKNVINNMVLNKLHDSETGDRKLILEKLIRLRSLNMFNKTISFIDFSKGKNIIGYHQVDGVNGASIIDSTIKLDYSPLFRTYLKTDKEESRFLSFSFPDLLLALFYIITGNRAFLSGKLEGKTKTELFSKLMGEGVDSSSKKSYLVDSLLMGSTDLESLSLTTDISFRRILSIRDSVFDFFGMEEVFRSLEGVNEFETVFGRKLRLKENNKITSIVNSTRADLIKTFLIDYENRENILYMGDKIVITCVPLEEVDEFTVKFRESFNRFLSEVDPVLANLDFVTMYISKHNLEKVFFF